MLYVNSLQGEAKELIDSLHAKDEQIEEDLVEQAHLEFERAAQEEARILQQQRDYYGMSGLQGHGLDTDDDIARQEEQERLQDQQEQEARIQDTLEEFRASRKERTVERTVEHPAQRS